MHINRHNYESFFLLLVDGELSTQQQQEVMMFVDANPDLTVELEAIYATKLPIEEAISFPNKEGLMRQAGASISLENYEEWFCAYIDKALTREEMAAVELFVLQHPSLQEEFLLIQQTVLPVETIVFANKELLYRKEAKRIVLIPYLRRLAVAAVFIAAVVAVWFVTRDTQSTTSQIIASNIAKNNGTDNKNSANNIALPNPSTTEKILVTGVTEKAVVRSMNETANNRISKDGIPEVSGQYLQLLAENQVAKNITEETVGGTINTNLSNTEAVGKVNEAVIAKTEVEMQEDEPLRNVEKVAYKEIDTDDNGKSLYVGAIEINKDKLRGFLRKAGSIFKSKSKQEEDKTDTSPQRLK